MCSCQYLIFDYFLSWFPMGVDFNGNASLGCYLRFLVCIDQKRAMIPLGLGQFARTRVTRARIPWHF